MVSNIRPDFIFFIGCGGTGSNLVPWLYNLVQSNYRFFSKLKKTLFLDPDTVSDQNFNRQNFLPWMSGKKKAFVFAKSYEKTLLAESFVVASNEDTLERLFKYCEIQESHSVWVICCPDNAEARRSSLAFLKKKALKKKIKNYFWISPGNDDARGTIGSHLVIDGFALSTDPMSLFPNWAQSNESQGLQDDGSYGCGGSEESGVQHFVLNGLAAIHTANILASLVEEGVYIPSAWFSGGVAPTVEYAAGINLEEVVLPNETN